MAFAAELSGAIDQARIVGRERFWRLAKPWAPREPVPIAAISIGIRYSVLYADRQDWRLSREGGFSAYRSALFSEERLRNRLRLFTRIVLPSLASQTLRMQRGLRELMVFISTELPARHRVALEQGLAPHDWARIVPVAPDANELPAPASGPIFASVRMDDDDALSRDYLARLSGYVRPEYAGKIVTFPHGFLAKFDPSGHAVFRREWKPKVSVGLAYIVSAKTPFRSIYEVGGHRRVDRVAPVVFDVQGPAYLKTVHEGSDKGATPFAPHTNITADLVGRFIQFSSPLAGAEPATA